MMNIKAQYVKTGVGVDSIHGTGNRGGYLIMIEGVWKEGAAYGCNWTDGQGHFSNTWFSHVTMLVNKDGVYYDLKELTSNARLGLLSTIYKVEMEEGLITQLVFSTKLDKFVPKRQLPLPEEVNCYWRFKLPCGDSLISPSEFFRR